MDRILTRPIHSLFQVILERMELESLFGAITGIIVMAYAAIIFTSIISSGMMFLFILLFILGEEHLYTQDIFIALASIGFWSDARTSIMPTYL